MTPYYSWKISHHTHHVNNSSMENDVLWVPHLRSDYKGLPEEGEPSVYEEYFSDSPLYSFLQLLAAHFVAYQAYLGKLYITCLYVVLELTSWSSSV